MPNEDNIITRPLPDEGGPVEKRSGLTGSGALQFVQAVTENPTVAGVATGVAAAKAMQMFSKPKDPPPAPPADKPPAP